MPLDARKRHTFGHRDLRTVTLKQSALGRVAVFLRSRMTQSAGNERYNINARTPECGWTYLNARIIRSLSIIKKKKDML